MGLIINARINDHIVLTWPSGEKLTVSWEKVGHENVIALYSWNFGRQNKVPSERFNFDTGAYILLGDGVSVTCLDHRSIDYHKVCAMKFEAPENVRIDDLSRAERMAS